MAVQSSKSTQTDASELIRQQYSLHAEKIAVVHSLTPTQEIADHYYHDLGLNVFPVPINQKGGYPWKRLQTARLTTNDLMLCFSGECNIAVMTGRTSKYLFIIDCETRRAYDTIAELLDQRGIAKWSTRSGGAKGGGHFYFFALNCEVENIPLAKAKEAGIIPDIEVRGRGIYVLVENSIHPVTGLPYERGYRDQIVPPTVDLEQLDFLPLKRYRKSSKTSTTLNLPEYAKMLSENELQKYQGSISLLSDSSIHFILNGAEKGQRNYRLFSGACDANGCGFDQEWAEEILGSIALKSGLKAREIEGTIKSAYSERREPTRSNSAKRVKRWQLAKHWIMSRAWPTRRGTRNRVIALALCERARLEGDARIFRASERDLSGLAHRSDRTAIRESLSHLQEIEFIEKRSLDELGSSLWAFGKAIDSDQVCNNLSTSSYATKTGLDTGMVITHPSPDMLSINAAYGGLGATPYLVYKTILASPYILPKDIRTITKLTRDQVMYALRKLKDLGIVRYDDSQIDGTGYVATPYNELFLEKRFGQKAVLMQENRVAQHQKDRSELATERILRSRKLYDRSVIAAKRRGN